jgi:AcrR family transcriptional regulator
MPAPVTSASPVVPRPPKARQRILDAAYDLFSQHGIRAVGIDSIIERSGVARMTLYRHFQSKDDLVLAFLEDRERRWTRDWLQLEVQRRASTPGDRLLAIFEVFDGWFRQSDFEGCSFINVLLEVADPADALHQASRDYLAHIRAFLEELATDAGVVDPTGFARQWHILMKGSIVAAAEGDTEAALRAQDVGRLLLSQRMNRRNRASR